MRHYLGIALKTLLWCAALGVLLQNLFLLKQVRDLRVLANPPDVSAGQQLGDLAAVNLEGAFTPIALPEKTSDKLLVIAMSPTCPICASNRSVWLDMSRDLKRRKGWRVIWVSRDPVKLTRQYCEHNNIPVEDVLADPDHRTYNELGMEKVPHMFVVTSTGIIDKVWGGRLDRPLTKDIFSYFGKSLNSRNQRTLLIPSTDEFADDRSAIVPND